MTSISSVSGLSSLLSTTTTQNTQRGKSPYEAVSSLLGMSADDIEKAVSDGTSLDQLAKDKGVSHDDLVTALKAGAPQELQSGFLVDVSA